VRSLRLGRPKILDWGCGTGWFTAQLAHLGDPTRVDLSETAVAFARSQFLHIKYIAGNLYDFFLVHQSFDVIIPHEVIAHVSDQLGLMDLMANLLTSGGYLVLTTVL
jgi:2-polyprenyl-3-methyl-5-hydroxy-6-metoxy-1,4-benzoquinol methylase